MLSVLPWFVPGLLVAAVVGLVTASWIARRLVVPIPSAFILVVAIGAILAATIPPDRGEFGDGHLAGTCDLSRLGPADLAQYLTFGDTSLNVVLFVPLGIALGTLPGAGMRRVGLVLALASPVLIELAQSAAPILGRGCESADIVDNMVGVLFGYLVGRVLFRLQRGLSPRRSWRP